MERKISARLYLFIGLSFLSLTFLLGISRTAILAVTVIFAWKAREVFLLKKVWRGETVFDKAMTEFTMSKLNEGSRSNNLWVAYLSDPELASTSKDYVVELLACPKLIRAESATEIQGWTKWRATRMEENLTNRDDDTLSERFSKDQNGRAITIRDVMLQKTVLEITLAEHALKLLAVPDPRAAIATLAAERGVERFRQMNPA